MRLSALTTFLGGLCLLAITSSCSDTKEYESRVQKERMDKDKHFKYTDASPLKNDQKEDFESLNYYPVNQQFRVEAKVKQLPKDDTFQMAYKNGEPKQYVRYARLTFELKGQECELYAYQNVDPSRQGGANPLFIPFYDGTNGRKTYGGGRYLDIKQEKVGDSVTLDFNKAYNPYCAYNERYACPIPPEENKLNTSIPAGEKQFTEAAK